MMTSGFVVIPTLAALVAAFALGANLLGLVLLLLFNHRSREARWYALFQLAICAWLLLQGLVMLAESGIGVGMGAAARWRFAYVAVIHLLPLLFLAYALVEALDWPLRRLAVVLALALLMVPPALAASLHWVEHPLLDGAVMLWQLAVWGSAGALIWWSRWHKAVPYPATGRVGTPSVVMATLALTPFAIVGGLWLGGDFFPLILLPLATVAVQLLIFYGIARLRFYDIEVRAARSGELAARAAEQERLAVLGELAASLAHEIRNPLTGVRSLTQRLAEEVVDEDRRRRYADVILEETGRLERIVGNLLGLARRPVARRQDDAANPLAALFGDLSLLLDAHARKAGVTLTVSGTDLVIPAPREALAQALLNLLLNAIAHSPRGGCVELIAREAEGAVELLVRDSGAGVPPADRERIFEPFHSGGDGTGLGLAVVRRLARELGWEIGVGEAPGGGAEFRIRFVLQPTSRP